MARRTVGASVSYSYGLSSNYYGPGEPHRNEPYRNQEYDDSRYEGPPFSRIEPVVQSREMSSVLERLKHSSTSEEALQLFPPPPKRFCPANERPVYKNGHCIPRQDALIFEMVLNDKASLKSQLDVTKQSIVGLDFVNEYIDPDGGIRIYECTLCKTFRAVNSIMEHIVGYNHRVNYIQKQFPSEVKMYLLPDGRNKNRNKALMAVASKRCSELELVYGRGDVTVLHEKPKIPEGGLDAPESDLLPEDKKLEELQKDLKKYSNLKIDNAEEFRCVRGLIATLTNALCEYKYSQEQSNS